MTDQEKLLQKKSFHNGLAKSTKLMNSESNQNLEYLNEIIDAMETDPKLAKISKVDCDAKITKATK